MELCRYLPAKQDYDQAHTILSSTSTQQQIKPCLTYCTLYYLQGLSPHEEEQCTNHNHHPTQHTDNTEGNAKLPLNTASVKFYLNSGSGHILNGTSGHSGNTCVIHGIYLSDSVGTLLNKR